MAKKVKDWYDKDYLYLLSGKIEAQSSAFDRELFLDLTEDSIDELSFGDRQRLMAEALRESMKASYEEALEVFAAILGPELTTNQGNFTSGYWLWPIGKFVELYGRESLQASLAFSKELTKRFTSEYCMRPLIEAYPEQVLPVLIAWSQDNNRRVRRLASECIRIRLPWAKKMLTALDYFGDYQMILTHLKDDPDPYIKKSVGNNLNDLYKESPDHFYTIVKAWQSEPMSPATAWIIKHGSRNIK